MLAKKPSIKQGVEILWIKPKELDQYWPLVHFMIAEGLQFDGNPMDVDQMRNFIATGGISALYDVWIRRWGKT